MNSSIQVFSKDEFSIRTIEENGEIWFVAKDVVEALEYSYWQPNLVSNVPDIWKGIKRINTPGGEQEMLCLTEQGLYFFLGRSDKSKALSYQIWIAGDVVPSIRATGGYRINNNARELDIRAAELLKSMIGLCPMTDETKAVLLHDAYKFLTGKECLSMLPKVAEPMYSATKIGEMFGVSKNRIGKIAKQHNLKSKEGTSNEYGTWIRDKSPYSTHECSTFVYNDNAIAWFKEYFKAEIR